MLIYLNVKPIEKENACLVIFLQRNSFLFILFWITCHRHKEGNWCY
jgi:hypothetical protein